MSLNNEEKLELARNCDAQVSEQEGLDEYYFNVGTVVFDTQEDFLAYTSAIEEKYRAQPNNYLGHITDNELISELNTRFGFEPVGYVRQYGPDCLKGTLPTGRAKTSTQIDPEPITDDDIPLFRLPSHTDAIEQMYKERIELLLKLVEEERESKLEWADRYNREMNGLNNEGDPIGGDPAYGMKHQVEDLCKQVAMLRNALIHHQKLTRPIDSSIEALSATQATADAFIAEVKAGERNAVLDELSSLFIKLYVSEREARFVCSSIEKRDALVKMMIGAELRNQDKQPCTCDGRCDGFCLTKEGGK